ncbi:hypothetical protein LEP1GSC123_1478 [Leptospira borgpetersenii str. 200701203]|uniref:Uncharacterized protein n=1 Tax=Leptospira borgpetersenii str. 200701203 TaxID=1193007 RepID=M3F8Y9_LEPBO|nr:hypothetical protein LEP1GSC123_1478 [Leptospira borgpetersenii str. 200701203]
MIKKVHSKSVRKKLTENVGPKTDSLFQEIKKNTIRRSLFYGLDRS